MLKSNETVNQKTIQSDALKACKMESDHMYRHNYAHASLPAHYSREAIGCIACNSPVCNTRLSTQACDSRCMECQCRYVHTYIHIAHIRQYIIVGQRKWRNFATMSRLYICSRHSQSGSCELLARAFTRRWSVSYPVLCSYTRRWLVWFSVRMATELFLPSPFPISVTHYPLKNRRSLSLRRSSSWSFSILEGGSYDIALLSLPHSSSTLFSLESRSNCGLTLQVSQIAARLYR